MENGRVGIVGAGIMGRGIALASLLSGFRVTLSDTNAEALANAQQYIKSQLESLVSKSKISPEQSSQAQNALTLSTRIDIHSDSSLVIESIIEQRQAKMELLKQLEEILPSTTIIATNTSSISINSLAAPLRYPQRFIGIHFFNPAHIMKLVEIIPSYYTDQSVIESAIEYARNLNKEPVVVRDVPGFLVNRVVRNYYNEALRIVSEGAATIEQVDRLMEGAGFRMGPFRLMDLIGIDTNLNVTKSIYEQYFYEPRYQPSPLQQSYVDAGLLGKKSGRGFYTYENNT